MLKVFLGYAILLPSFLFAANPLQQKLAKGWNTWNTHNTLSHAYLPEGFSVNLCLIQRHFNAQKYLWSAAIQNKKNETKIGEQEALVKPLYHTYNGSYTAVEVEWQKAHVLVETASDGEQWSMLITPLSQHSDTVLLVLEAGMLWNRPGSVQRKDKALTALTPNGKTWYVQAAQALREENFTPSNGPFLSCNLNGPSAFYTGTTNLTVTEIQAQITKAKNAHLAYSAKYGAMQTAWLGMQSCLAWNTVYDVKKDRVFTTVDRSWNVNRGGYVFFGWDNFFLSFMVGLDEPVLAYANAIEALHEATQEGFISNNSQGNGRKSWDRSQPPIGSMMCMEIYQRNPQKWFLDSVYAPLLKWNRWWTGRRMNGKLLAWGSHKAQNPFKDKRHHDAKAAMLESGIDDSPMYEEVAFDSVRNVLEIQDVGLNALYIRDCQVLAQMAKILGKGKDAQELEARAKTFSQNLQQLWNPKTKMYQNYRTDVQAFSPRLSPTLFYPLIAHAATPKQANDMIQLHFYNEKEFWGSYILPSISRNDPEFEKQAYWKGSIWAPMNFLVYLGLRQYPELSQARKDLASKSVAMFEGGWKKNGFVSENYSAFTGTGDDPKLNSSGWYAWGGLMAAIGIMEAEMK